MHPKPTVRFARVVRHELVDHDAPVGQLGDALRDAEMYRTHGVGVDECGRHERTRAQYHVDAVTASMNGRVEALALHRLDDERDRIVFGGRTESLTPAGATPDFNGRVARADAFR